MSTSALGAVGALSIDRSARYNSILEFVKFNIYFTMIYMSFMFISTTSASSNITHVHIHVVINML
jgi:hypothetical protein